MELLGWTITALVIFIALGLLLSLVIRTVMRIVSVLLIIAAVIVFLFGFIMLNATQSLSKSLSTEPTLYLLENDGLIIAGARIRLNTTIPLSKFSDAVVSGEELGPLTLAYLKKDHKTLLGENKHVLIYNIGVFDDAKGPLRFGDPEGQPVMVPREFVRGMLLATDPVGLYAQDAIARMNLSGEDAQLLQARYREAYRSGAHIKGMLFMAMLSEALEGGHNAAVEYQNGKVLILPESLALKMLKTLPKQVRSKLNGR